MRTAFWWAQHNTPFSSN
jgi:hypothetical protein